MTENSFWEDVNVEEECTVDSMMEKERDRDVKFEDFLLSLVQKDMHELLESCARTALWKDRSIRCLAEPGVIRRVQDVKEPLGLMLFFFRRLFFETLYN